MLRSASALADQLEQDGQPHLFAERPDGTLGRARGGETEAVLSWHPDRRWECCLPAHDPRSAFLHLYLPICGATAAHPVTIGHLGQSLDGFIATPSGDSQFVTGSDNLVHVHRLRALCDAVVVGAGTVAADDPQLTTRHVPGPSPLRVIIDPGRRLDPSLRIFSDRQAPTLYICAHERLEPAESYVGAAATAGIDPSDPRGEVMQVMQLLRARGCRTVLVEGGGVTVSAFLEAALLDRLQIAIAPVLIGEGRPAIRLEARTLLRDCLRPAYRVYQMGGDVLFDCDLHAGSQDIPGASQGTLSRVI